jgi:hypothetical protein
MISFARFKAGPRGPTGLDHMPVANPIVARPPTLTPNSE